MDRGPSTPPRPRGDIFASTVRSGDFLVDVVSITGDITLHRLAVSVETTLGDIQRDLCGAFGYAFPKYGASLRSGQNVWTEFDQLPFTHLVKDEKTTFVVDFDLTSDMRFHDQQRNHYNRVTLRLPDETEIVFKMKNIALYEHLMYQLKAYFSAEDRVPCGVSRADSGSVPELCDLIEEDAVLHVHF